MGENVARPQPREHLFIARRRLVDMRHQRQAHFVRDLQCDVERHGSRATRGAGADAHFDADNDVSIGVGNLRGVVWRHQADFLALSDHHARREGVDAGKGDMQIGKDAHLAALDHMLAEPRKVAGAGAAGIDCGRDAGAAAEILGVDAERGAAPVDMGVQIDQSRCDNAA